MKKFISILLSFIFIFSLSACSGDKNDSKDDSAKKQSDKANLEDDDYSKTDETETLAPKEGLIVGDIGTTVKFGKYEQDNNLSNDKEDIEWIVLAKEGNKALLISKYCLDAQAYNTEFETVTWETCSLRNWLNSTFINDAFSAKEQAKIVTSLVKNDANPYFVTEGGKDTNDKVFLLSIDEAETYFTSDEARMVSSTEYANARGAYVGSNGRSSWLLRSPGESNSGAASVSWDDGRSLSGSVNRSFGGVRPVLWINL